MQDSEQVCGLLYDLARARNGQNCFITLNGVEVFLVQSPAGADHVLRRNARNYVKNMAWFRRTLGASRFSEDGEAWEARRALTQPAFNRFDREHAFAVATGRALVTLRALAEAGARGAQRLSDDALRDLTADILLRSFFGRSLAESGVDMRLLAEAMTFASEYSFIPEGETGRQFRDRLPELLRSRRQVLEMMRFFRSPALDGQPLAERLREADRERRAGMVLEHEMITFLAAGSEASAATIGWATWLLARYPQLQESLREEARAFWRAARADAPAAAPGAARGCPAGGGAAAGALAKLAQWPRFGRFISETLRLFPVTPILARLPLADDVIGGQPVAAGQNVLVSLIGVSHAGRSPADPWAPDLEAAGGRPVQGDVAFGLGPRVCGGKQFAMLELTAVLVAFLASARFTLTSDEAPRFRWKTQMLRAGGQPVRVELT